MQIPNDEKEPKQEFLPELPKMPEPHEPEEPGTPRQPEGMTLNEGLLAICDLALALADEQTGHQAIMTMAVSRVEMAADLVRQFVRERNGI